MHLNANIDYAHENISDNGCSCEQSHDKQNILFDLVLMVMTRDVWQSDR